MEYLNMSPSPSDGEVIDYVVYTFSVDGFVDDPELYAAEKLHEWEISEEGQWVKRNSIPNTLVWKRMNNYANYQYNFCIWCKFKKEDLIMWKLKFK